MVRVLVNLDVKKRRICDKMALYFNFLYLNLDDQSLPEPTFPCPSI